MRRSIDVKMESKWTAEKLLKMEQTKQAKMLIYNH